MAAVEYGTIGIRPMRDYNPNTKYGFMHLVDYDGSSYVAHTDPPLGSLPTDTNYWQVSALGTSKATANSVGTVKPDGTTTEVSADGSLSAKTATQSTLGLVKGSNGIKVGIDGNIDVNTLFTQATELANIIAEEAISSVLGKISKSIAVTMGLNENALLKNMLTNMDANDNAKINTAAFIHTLYERIGMSEDLDIGANLTAVVKALNSNLTNVSNGLNNKTVISSGLSLTWGTVALGGYTLIGNLIVINVRITTNTTLNANQSYNIDGFPVPATSGGNNVPATSNIISQTRDAYVNSSGSFVFTPNAQISSSAGIMLHACYIRQ
jgi:hypothetical protein